MSELDEKTRRRYLEEMGITVWSRRDATPVPETAETGTAAAGMAPEAAAPSLKAAVPAEEAPPVSDIPAFLSDMPPPEAFFDGIPPAPFDGDLSAPALPDPVAVPDTETAAGNGPDSWEKLLDEIGHCERCHLCKTRNRIVPGVGDKNAGWLFIGEGPGFHEDQQGEPFVGRSGKLLDSMMAAMQMKRGDNVYIANVVKCRASNEYGKDRQPTEEEAAICMPYLERQIDLIKPTIMVALGKTAAVALLNTGRDVTLGSLRNREHFFRNGGRKIPLVVTYHPSYLLRTPGGKKQAWQDLCRAMDIYDEEKKKEE